MQFKIIGKMLLVVLACSLITLEASAERRPMNAVDMVEITRPTSPALSPDGSRLVYLRSETDWVANKTTQQLYLMDVATGDSRKLFEKLSDSENHASAYWSPDGNFLLMSMKRKGDKRKQAYCYSLETSELKRLTEHAADIGRARWSQDGAGIFLFTSRIDDPEREDKKDWFLKEYETRQPNEIWYFDVATGDSKPLVAGDYSVRSFSESFDGSRLLYSRATHNQIDRPGSELWLRDTKDGSERQITQNNFSERSPQLSPDNRYVAYIATVNERGEQYYEDNLFIQSLESGRSELVLPKMAIEMDRFHWGPEGKSLYFTGNTGLRSQLYRYTLESKVLEPLTDGDQVVADWRFGFASGLHTFVVRDVTQPGEVYTLATSGPAKRLTHDQQYLQDSFVFAEQRAIKWRSRGGATIEGLLVYPIGYDFQNPEAKPFPLVTISHGGPRSSAQFGTWNSSRYVPVLTAEGYGVFLPNYRGGHGYGDKFARSMVGDYFRHSHLDVMSGIDHLIKQGLADPDQLIKMGWSAGGHMVNKLITYTDRFKAASSGAGVADWVSMYGESDVRHNRTPWFGGSPWQRKAPIKSYNAQSPLKDAWQITTPTLFWNGKEDVRVPPTQAIMMYRGAKAAGVETELYLAPKQPHNFKVPTYKLFKINTELAWYAKHLNRKAYTPLFPPAFYEEKATTEQVRNQGD